MQSEQDDPQAVFEKGSGITTAPPGILVRIIRAFPFFLLLCSPLGYLLGYLLGGPYGKLSQYISFFLAGFGILLLIARKLDRRPHVIRVASDQNNLTIISSNNVTATIPWREITKIEYWGTLYVVGIDAPPSLVVKHGSQSISLGLMFACDYDFVKKLQNHPAYKNKANDETVG